MIDTAAAAVQWLYYFIFIITDPSKPAAQGSEGGGRDERGRWRGRQRGRRGAGWWRERAGSQAATGSCTSLCCIEQRLRVVGEIEKDRQQLGSGRRQTAARIRSKTVLHDSVGLQVV